MTLTYTPIAADDPRVGVVVADLRERQRGELLASGWRKDWREIEAEIASLATPRAAAHRVWLVEQDGAPVAVVLLAFLSACDIQASFLATQRWERGVPRGFYRWIRQTAFRWADSLGVCRIEVDVWEPPSTPFGGGWLLRLGFDLERYEKGAGPKGWTRFSFVRQLVKPARGHMSPALP